MLCTKECRYNVIKRACRKLDFKLDANEECDFDVWWSDTGVTAEKIRELKPHQRINSLPNIQAISRKNNLAKHLCRMQKLAKGEYSFFP